MGDHDDDVFEDTLRAEAALDTDRTGNGTLSRHDTVDEASNSLEKVKISITELNPYIFYKFFDIIQLIEIIFVPYDKKIWLITIFR